MPNNGDGTATAKYTRKYYLQLALMEAERRGNTGVANTLKEELKKYA